MMRKNANDITFDKVGFVINGKEYEGLFSDIRVLKDSLLPGAYMYELRHGDEGWDVPYQIKEGILVNFFGTLITRFDIMQMVADTENVKREDAEVWINQDDAEEDFWYSDYNLKITDLTKCLKPSW